MLPEISARRSLLEPRFRCLSPGREGEKCRPLDHMWQIPFIHSVRFVLLHHFHIYVKDSQLPLPCGYWIVSWYGRYSKIAHVRFKNYEPRVKNNSSNYLEFHYVSSGAYWHKTQWLFCMRGKKKRKRTCLHIVPTYQSLWVFSLCLSVSRTQNWKEKAINSKVRRSITTS